MLAVVHHGVVGCETNRANTGSVLARTQSILILKSIRKNHEIGTYFLIPLYNYVTLQISIQGAHVLYTE